MTLWPTTRGLTSHNRHEPRLSKRRWRNMARPNRGLNGPRQDSLETGYTHRRIWSDYQMLEGNLRVTWAAAAVHLETTCSPWIWLLLEGAWCSMDAQASPRAIMPHCVTAILSDAHSIDARSVTAAGCQPARRHQDMVRILRRREPCHRTSSRQLVRETTGHQRDGIILRVRRSTDAAMQTSIIREVSEIQASLRTSSFPTHAPRCLTSEYVRCVLR